MTNIHDQYSERVWSEGLSAPRLVLDLSRAKSINRGGVGALRGLAHNVKTTGGELILADVPEKIKPQLSGLTMIELLPQREGRFKIE